MNKKQDALQKFLIENNLSDNVDFIEYFSKSELDSETTLKVFKGSYPILSGNLSKISTKCLTFPEKLLLSKHGLIDFIFQSEQAYSAYYTHDNHFGNEGTPPLASADLANEALGKVDTLFSKPNLSFEESHAVLLSQCIPDLCFNHYEDSITSYNPDTMSLLDTGIIYKKMSVNRYIDLSRYINELQVFNEFGASNACIHVRYKDELSVYVVIHESSLRLFRSNVESDKEHIEDLESFLVSARECNTIKTKGFSKEVLTEAGLKSLKLAYKNEENNKLFSIYRNADLLGKLSFQHA